MLKVNFCELNSIEDSKLHFAVIMARHKEKWVFVRHKERETWEIPGGHREENENISDTASRELFEETGALKFSLTPVCIYCVERNENINYTESFGQLFYSEIEVLDNLPRFEIGEIKLFDNMPNNLTYPLIQPFLYNKVLEFLKKIN